MGLDRQLLFRVSRKDFKIEAYRGTGNGGQNKNKRDTACRIRHPDSGAVATAEEHRTFEQNRKAAFLRLTKTAKFRVWHAEMVQIAQGLPSIEERVERAMAPRNIKVETKDEKGRWADAPEL